MGHQAATYGVQGIQGGPARRHLDWRRNSAIFASLEEFLTARGFRRHHRALAKAQQFAACFAADVIT